MSEAPKKIWIDPENRPLEWWDEEYKEDGDAEYIRADLVDGLVALLKQDLEWMENGEEPGYGGEQYNKVKAALKALDEEAVDYEPAEPREGSAHLMEK